MALEDYKDLVATAAGIVTVGQMFSGVFVCKEIYDKGSASHIPPSTFLGGLVIGVLFLQHGILMNDTALGLVNFIGVGLSVAYLVFYYTYTADQSRDQFLSQLNKCVLFLAVCIGYAYIENPKEVEFRFGVIVTIFMMIIIALPMFSLGDIMRKKSTEGLPFPMILSGLVVSFHWLLYGIIIKNSVVIFQNLYAVVMCAAQLSLFVIYPSKPSKPPTKTE